jgi:hypothetical protein
VPVLGAGHGPAGRVGRPPIAQQPLVAGVQPSLHVGVDALAAAGACPVSRQLGIHQQLGHANRPPLAGLVGDPFQLTHRSSAMSVTAYFWTGPPTATRPYKPTHPARS